MRLENELRLSYYRELSDVDERHAVKLVQHTESGRVFVLKKLKIYDIAVFRYLEEQPSAGIPRIEELIEEDGCLYVVEEYVSGMSLRDKLTADGPMDEGEAVKLVKQLCSILTPLHRLDPPVVHRDIKPGNIIITPDGKAVLVDFNSAKESREEQSRDTVLIGTAGYAAPEQYGFSQSRPTADVYAMGVLMNEMLTGRLPGEKRYEGRLGPIIEKCLQMDPANRYQNAGELLRALNNQSSALSVFWAKFRQWLPPGLRSRNIWVVLASSLWYASIIAISCAVTLDKSTGFGLTAARIMTFAVFFVTTLWLGNYRGLWERLPLSKSKNKYIKVLGVIVWALVWPAAVILIAGIVMGLASL